MANLRDLAIELATTNLVADLVAEHKDVLREQMAHAFNELGSDSVKVSVDDEKIGKVSLVEPKAKTFVSDETALLRWVCDERPDEVLMQIRESFKKYLLDNVEVLDDGTCVLATTGEIVPGISARKSSAYVSTRFEKDGREKLIAAIKSGKVVFDLPAVSTKQIEG
jgi:hypothetical protein